VGIVLAIAFAAETARADTYRSQVIAADAISLGTVAAAGKADRKELVYLGIAGMALSAPIVHVVHHDYTGAAMSLGLHTVLPLAGAGFARAREWGVVAMIAGAVVGFVAADVVDAVWLAKDRGSPTTARMLAIGGRF
jgi:hypothetical protein